MCPIRAAGLHVNIWILNTPLSREGEIRAHCVTFPFPSIWPLIGGSHPWVGRHTVRPLFMIWHHANDLWVPPIRLVAICSNNYLSLPNWAERTAEWSPFISPAVSCRFPLTWDRHIDDVMVMYPPLMHLYHKWQFFKSQCSSPIVDPRFWEPYRNVRRRQYFRWSRSPLTSVGVKVHIIRHFLM